MQHYGCPVLILSWYFYLCNYFIQMTIAGNTFASNSYIQLIEKFTSGLQFESLLTSFNLQQNPLQSNSLFLVAYYLYKVRVGIWPKIIKTNLSGVGSNFHKKSKMTYWVHCIHDIHLYRTMSDFNLPLFDHSLTFCLHLPVHRKASVESGSITGELTRKLSLQGKLWTNRRALLHHFLRNNRHNRKREQNSSW